MSTTRRSLIILAFIFCANTLSCLINEAQKEGKITGFLFKGMKQGLTHSLFADDLMIYGSISEWDYIAFHQILQTYCSASGQLVTWKKSAIFLNYDQIDLHTMYIFKIIFNCKVCDSNLASWKGKFILQPGSRIILSKACLSAWPQYLFRASSAPSILLINWKNAFEILFWLGVHVHETDICMRMKFVKLWLYTRSLDQHWPRWTRVPHDIHFNEDINQTHPKL